MLLFQLRFQCVFLFGIRILVEECIHVVEMPMTMQMGLDAEKHLGQVFDRIGSSSALPSKMIIDLWRPPLFHQCLSLSHDSSKFNFGSVFIYQGNLQIQKQTIYVTIGRVLFSNPIAFVDAVTRRTYFNLMVFCFTWL